MDKSPQVLALQVVQSASRERAYAAMAAGDQLALEHANAQYDATVLDLVAELGPDAHCAEVDCDLFGFYSDCYKDRNGFRPRGHVTRKQVQEWMERDSSQPYDDEDDPSIGAEDFTLVARVFPDPLPLPYEQYDPDCAPVAKSKQRRFC